MLANMTVSGPTFSKLLNDNPLLDGVCAAEMNALQRPSTLPKRPWVEWDCIVILLNHSQLPSTLWTPLRADGLA